MPPCVEAAGGHPEYATELSDRILGLLHRDEPSGSPGRPLGKEGRRLFQDVSFVAQHAVLTTGAQQLWKSLQYACLRYGL